jgi:N-acetylglutamate synthase-like GNAT family acetyltransferase
MIVPFSHIVHFRAEALQEYVYILDTPNTLWFLDKGCVGLYFLGMTHVRVVSLYIPPHHRGQHHSAVLLETALNYGVQLGVHTFETHALYPPIFHPHGFVEKYTYIDTRDNTHVTYMEYII